jgi:hypothetical protein
MILFSQRLRNRQVLLNDLLCRFAIVLSTGTDQQVYRRSIILRGPLQEVPGGSEIAVPLRNLDWSESSYSSYKQPVIRRARPVLKIHSVMPAGIRS